MLILGIGVSFAPISRGDVSLAAQDGFDSRVAGRLVKLESPKEIAVVGDRHRRHPVLLRHPGDLGKPAHAVKQRIFGVRVEVHEGTTLSPAPREGVAQRSFIPTRWCRAAWK